jgi:endonuclease/exonuclease/phosphatase family metal-dependent hydrolase
VATFNVWFSPHKWKERLAALVDLLLHVENVDVICFQEVTPHFWTKLLEYEGIRKLYRVTDNTKCATLGKYGVAMLIRRSSLPVPTTVTWVTLPTRMGRSALVVVYERSSAEQTSTAQTNQENSSSSSVAIATVHLESLQSEETRTKQLQSINNVLANYGTAMLLGDYNITASGPRANHKEHENVVSLLPGYVDLWVREHGVDGDVASALAHASGTTFDARSNSMLKALRPSGEPEDHARLDRVMIKEQSGVVHAHGVRIIGNQPIGPDLFISDHFGLVFELSLPV